MTKVLALVRAPAAPALRLEARLAQDADVSRAQLHLEAGQQFIFVAKGNVINLVPKQDMEQLRGLLKGANPENSRDRQDRA